MSDRILVVDDEETIREVYREYLAEEDLSVAVASSGREALDMLKKERFALVLIDLIMPDMDGLELVEEIRKLKIDTPAAMLTAYEVMLDESKRKELKIAGVIPKDTPMSEISKKIKILTEVKPYGKKGN